MSLIISTIVLVKVHTYDSVSVTGIINCQEKCEISFTLPYNQVDILNSSPFIYYNNEMHQVNNISYAEPYITGNTIYEDIIIESDIYSANSLVNIKILNNRQRMIEKIKNIILER